MSNYTRNEIVTGVFIVGAVGVFALFAFRVGNVDAFGVLRASGTECVAHFADIKTLDDGAKVTVAGRRVGSVRSIELAERPVLGADIEKMVDYFGPDAVKGMVAGMLQARVRVEFELDDPQLRFDLDTARVSLVQDGFLGRHYLAFYPGHWNANEPPPMSGDLPDETFEIAVTETGGLDQLIATVNPAVRRVDALLETIQKEVFNVDGVENTRRALGDLAALLRDLAALVDAEHPDGLHATVLTPLRNLLVRANDSFDDIEQRLLIPAEDLLRTGPALVSDARSVLGSVDGMLAESRPHVVNLLSQLDASTRELDAQLGAVMSEAEGLLATARATAETTSPEVAETARRLRRAMWQAEMAARKIRANPAYLLFGSEEVDYEERARERADVWRGGRVRAYRQRDESDGK